MLTILLIILIVALLFGGLRFPEGRVLLWILAIVAAVIILTRL